MTKSLHILCAILSFWLLFLTKPNAAYSVVNFGARGDGRTDSTQAFRKAWAWACSSARPVTITVPKGKYVVQPTYFNGPCRHRMTILIQGTILGPYDYRVLAKANYWLMFYRVNGLTVRGGTVDARGAGFWSCRRHSGYCYGGAQSIQIIGCNNVVLNGVTSLNSQKSHLSIKGGKNIALNSLRLRAPSGSPNTDGMNIQSSSGITIFNNVIKTGDDCIALGPGSRNVWIERVACGPGHGISIGSLGNSRQEEGVQNITVVGVVFTKTDNGVRIKSWARPSTGFVRGVTFRNIVMNNVYNPIIIDQKYCINNQCPNQNSGVKITGVKYHNIRGTSRSKVAIALYCSPSTPCTGITMQDIKLTYKHSPATTACSYAHGGNRGRVIPRGCL